MSASQWIEISAGALRHNVGVFRQVLTPGTRIAAVVKANAYGHGVDLVATQIEDDVDFFAVHSAQEARNLRRIGVAKPVLVMGFVPPGDMTGLDADVHFLVSTPEELEWLGEIRQREGVAHPVHFKVETGTNRQGVRVEALQRLSRAAALQGLEIAGLATHFANIEDTLEHDFARRQLDVFNRAIERVRRELGSDPPFIHAACSAAALLFREADFSMVRVGIGLYGHWPSRETRLSWILEHGENGLGLEPVLSWKSVVGQVKEVPAGETVGYGRTWQALRPTRLAVIPVGYSDGYPRVMGNRGRILAGGRPAPVVGRVCMNIFLADVTDHPGVGIGDEVVLIGRSGAHEVSAEEVASLSGTINYEILSRLSPQIHRRLAP
ncbi:MAG: alanine racemase [Acidobacteria bacterium]|nr:alanine racemase [Acidobacteriota bacterium]